MLAAHTAWLIFESEHRRIRELLDEIAALAASEAWHRGETAPRLQALLTELETFDREAHRPKGQAMLRAMTGRSAAADQHVDALMDDRARADDALAHAKALLPAAIAGDERARHEWARLFDSYRHEMAAQMHEEETLLRAHAEALLTEEEWSLVISQISTRVAAGKEPARRSRAGS
jgi:hypothetical protein